MMASSREHSEQDIVRLPPDEERSIVHQAPTDHDRNTLDEPIPALGNQTPRKAVKTAKGRKKVIKGDRVAEDAGEPISAAASRGSDGRLRLHVAVARTRRWRRAAGTGSRRGVRQCGKARHLGQHMANALPPPGPKSLWPNFSGTGVSDCAVGNTARGNSGSNPVPANRRGFLIHRNSRNFGQLARRSGAARSANRLPAVLPRSAPRNPPPVSARKIAKFGFPDQEMESPKPRRHVRQIERGGRIARTRRGLVTCQYRAMGSVLARRSSFCWERRSSPPSARRCDAHSNSCRFLPFGQRPASDLSRQSGSGAAGGARLWQGQRRRNWKSSRSSLASPFRRQRNGWANFVVGGHCYQSDPFRDLRSPAGTRWSTAWEPYNVASAIPTAMAVRSRLQRNELCDERERSSRRRSPRTLVLPLGHSTRFAVDRFLQESRTAPTLHRIDLKSAKRRDDRDRIVGIGKYFVTYGGEVIGEFSCAECDVARWLLARAWPARATRSLRSGMTVSPA